jgi:hypothetical protein
MSVSATNAFSGPFVGNGVTAAFPFTFDAGAAEEVAVVADGIEVSAADYTVTLNAGGNGGTVTFDTAPALGVKIIPYSSPDFAQDVGFTNAGSFLPETHDEVADRAARRDIYLNAKTDRTIRLPLGETADDLPPALDRVGQVLGFDGIGDLALLDRANFAGSPGGNVMSIGTFAAAPGMAIPAGTTAVQVSGTTTNGDTGNGRQFVEAAEVNAAFVTNNPLIAFRDTGGRGFREVDVKTGRKIEPYLLVISGQSNALGANNGGPNPASPGVKTWNGSTGLWGGSDYTAAPWSLASPHGNSGNNNTALAAAHRIYEETRRPVFIVMDAQGGTSIDAWVATGTASARYVALKAKVEAALASAQLSSTGKTVIDGFIWSQGEEDYTDDFATHLANLQLLDTQLRAEIWMDEFTPSFITGMSGLHDRYPTSAALRHFCNKSNGTWNYVSSRGIKTLYDTTGAGDFTHFLGPSLWEFGYNRIATLAVNTRKHNAEIDQIPFYGRGAGRLTNADPTAIATFDHLVSWASRDTGSAAVNSHAATGSIAWGEQCVSDGNYTFALGYQNTTANLSNYTLAGGREVTSGDNGDYGIGWGYQLSLTGAYQAAFGRGNTLVTDGEFAAGLFSKYTDGSRLFQYGVGTSGAARKNALGVAAAGNVEILAPAAGTDPGQREEVTLRRISDTVLRLLMKGNDDAIRSVELPLLADATPAVIASGVYTPAATLVTNCDAVTPNESRWQRISNVVFVSGSVLVDATAAADTQFKLALPVASNMTVVTDLSGTLTQWVATLAVSGAIQAAPTDDTANCRLLASSTAAQTYQFNFAYTVKP